MGCVKKRILILGSTGSIGTQALEVIEENPDLFSVAGLAAGGRSPELLIEQAQRHSVPAHRVAIASEKAADTVVTHLGDGVVVGPNSAHQLVEAALADGDVDLVLNGLVGSMGLHSTLATIQAGVPLALANKESLVAGGEFVRKQAAPGQIIPVDSEHSAMAQCWRSGRDEEVARLVLTASGGPFRGWSREEMWEVTPQQAAAHPTWSMGQMNTLNSATLINKGLELIEAALLFGVDPDAIDVTVHPQSIIHSMVTFTDGATIAQASVPSMKLPIGLAMNWPHRVAEVEPAVDFSQAFSWDFEPVDNEAFPAVELARTVARAGGAMPAVYNASNEEAAAAFLDGQIHFPQIVDTVGYVVEKLGHWATEITSVDMILDAEKEARAAAQEYLAGL
ncbi:1-deoxy-D-xylulose-5-phosphate reductoisomerase [Corynebacterium renale]|uniref:1-deoxy-D-xylulose 5-phosphate reductoisomerase n=1 Tax=Corynebacterium renale TaxID=1724 RepID=A0A2A9DQQ5_9CORY|nr:1-deoxy-D-xylulose-5-phosphate reductoisomerase [Corynebacterium renale]PFG28505.1 1-deoxy-D-xylulose 5-phosphate reductoisomerase [Corynebacterium renale]SQI26287.1 1-deoxy-D-xylulose 5-phosphate reductoisomerase [Corynebacterium renale]